MKAQYLNRYNEETKQTEQFYPITHADAVIDLNQNDLMDTEPVGSVEEDDEATVLPVIEDRFAALEQKIANIEDKLGEAIVNLSSI